MKCTFKSLVCAIPHITSRSLSLPLSLTHLNSKTATSDPLSRVARIYIWHSCRHWNRLMLMLFIYTIPFLNDYNISCGLPVETLSIHSSMLLLLILLLLLLLLSTRRPFRYALFPLLLNHNLCLQIAPCVYVSQCTFLFPSTRNMRQFSFFM